MYGVSLLHHNQGKWFIYFTGRSSTRLYGNKPLWPPEWLIATCGVRDSQRIADDIISRFYAIVTLTRCLQQLRHQMLAWEEQRRPKWKWEPRESNIPLPHLFDWIAIVTKRLLRQHSLYWTHQTPNGNAKARSFITQGKKDKMHPAYELWSTLAA